MRRRLGLLLAALVLAGCEMPRLPWGERPAEHPESRGYMNPHTLPQSEVLSASPAGMREALARAYRLPPDRRFLLAAGEIYSLLTGWPPGEMTARFRDGAWRIRCDQGEVGALPALPDFPDALAVLTDWALRVNGVTRPPLPRATSASPAAEFAAQIDRLAVPQLFAALRRMDARWNGGGRSAALFPPALRALVLLAAQSVDRAEMADAVPAKALALLALSQALAGQVASREESLLAKLMGYVRHARAVAAGLPASDPVRQYVLGDSEGLRAAAQAAEATAESRYLWLLRLVELREEKEAHALRQSAFREPAFVFSSLKTGLDLDRFDTNLALSAQVPGIAIGELARELGKPVEGWRERLARWTQSVVAGGLLLGDSLVRRVLGRGEEGPSEFALRAALAMHRLVERLLGTGLPGLMDRFEAGVEAAGARLQGPFLDARTYAGYFRGFFYSGLYVRGIHVLDRLSSVPAVTEYAEQLGAPRRPAAADFARWYRHLAESKAGTQDPAKLFEGLTALPTLGFSELRRGFTELDRRLIHGDPAGLVAAQRLAARLDTRVDNRLFFANTAYRILRDMVLFERLYQSAQETGHLHYHAIWYANFTRDVPRLIQLLRDPEIRPEYRIQILGHLEKLEQAPPDLLKAEYRRLIAEKPQAWSTREKYVDYLDRIRDYRTAVSVILEWLEATPEPRGFDRIYARATLSRTYERQGKLAEAWDAIEPVIGSWQAWALQRAARVLHKLGRRDEAVEMARRAVSRYPDAAPVRTTLAELYWGQGKPVEAAKALTAGRHRLSTADWISTVTPEFVAAFKARPADGAAAVAALLGANAHRGDLHRMAEAVARAGQPDLAFAIVSRIPWRETPEMIVVADGYKYLKATQGRAAALAWVRKTMPRGRLNEFAPAIYWSGEHELLWDLVEKPETGPEPDRVWLLRAAAAARLDPKSDPHRPALLRYYGGPGPRHYHAFGRYLLGTATEAETLALATDPQRRCEVAFYLALRAKAEGRYVDASDWLRVAIETRQVRLPEHIWAYTVISEWQGAGKSLALLEAERR